MPPRRRKKEGEVVDDGPVENRRARNDSARLASATVTRLTVNIGPATAEALQVVVDREGVTLTEALRRLVGYGDLLYRTVKVDKKDVLIRSNNETQQVLIA